MESELYAIICEQIEAINKLTAALQSGTGGDFSSLITPVNIEDNQPKLFVSRNKHRVTVIIHNNSGSPLYVALSNDKEEVGEEYYSYEVPSYEHLVLKQESPLGLYKKEIWGAWERGAAEDSRALVTELSITT